MAKSKKTEESKEQESKAMEPVAKKAKVKNIDKVTCVEGIYLDQRKDEWKVTVKEDNIISF